MEEILMNGVRSLENEAKRIEAIDALRLIEEMPDGAVLIFAAFVRKLATEGIVKQTGNYTDSFPDCQLNMAVYLYSLKYVYNSSGYAHYDPKLSIGDFLVQDILLARIRKPENDGDRCYVLTETGKWLAEWITNNPAPCTKTEEAHPAE